MCEPDRLSKNPSTFSKQPLYLKVSVDIFGARLTKWATLQEWRAEVQPEKFRLRKDTFDLPLKSGNKSTSILPPSCLLFTIILGLAFWHKHDKLGRPCLVVIPRVHVPKETTVDITYQACVYFLEKAKSR